MWRVGLTLGGGAGIGLYDVAWYGGKVGEVVEGSFCFSDDDNTVVLKFSKFRLHKIPGRVRVWLAYLPYCTLPSFIEVPTLIISNLRYFMVLVVTHTQ